MNVQTEEKLSPIGVIALTVLTGVEKTLVDEIYTNYFNVLGIGYPESLNKELTELLTKIKTNKPLTEKEILATSFMLVNMMGVIDEHLLSTQKLMHMKCVGNG